MKNVTTQQFSSPATSLPLATPHLVSHLYDAPMTYDEYSSFLLVCHEEFSRLRTLFAVIQLDQDVEKSLHIFHLAQIGESSASALIREFRTRQHDCKVALAKAQL